MSPDSSAIHRRSCLVILRHQHALREGTGRIISPQSSHRSDVPGTLASRLTGPRISPPPPMGAMTASRSPACSRSSMKPCLVHDHRCAGARMSHRTRPSRPRLSIRAARVGSQGMIAFHRTAPRRVRRHTIHAECLGHQRHVRALGMISTAVRADTTDCLLVWRAYRVVLSQQKAPTPWRFSHFRKHGVRRSHRACHR